MRLHPSIFMLQTSVVDNEFSRSKLTSGSDKKVYTSTRRLFYDARGEGGT